MKQKAPKETKVVLPSEVAASSEPKARRAASAARSLNPRGSFINTLAPIHEGAGTPVEAGEEDQEEEEVEEKEVPFLEVQPRPLKQSSSLLSSQMASSSPSPSSSQLPALLPSATPFADHSAANDIVSLSYQRKGQAPASVSALNSGQLPLSSHGIANLDAIYASAALEPGNRSGKTVSFSQTNQTIDANNTIRASSVSLAIHPAAAAGEREEEVIIPNPPPRSKALSQEPVTGDAAAAAQRPGLNANLHVEMINMAHSMTMSMGSRVLTMSGRQSFLSSVATHEPPGGADDQQADLTEKAVVVIRRVREKLTGLDFPDPSLAAAGNASGVQALAVPEQVERLIREATSNENLSQSFFGWCPYW